MEETKKGIDINLEEKKATILGQTNHKEERKQGRKNIRRLREGRKGRKKLKGGKYKNRNRNKLEG